MVPTPAEGDASQENPPPGSSAPAEGAAGEEKLTPDQWDSENSPDRRRERTYAGGTMHIKAPPFLQLQFKSIKREHHSHETALSSQDSNPNSGERKTSRCSRRKEKTKKETKRKEKRAHFPAVAPPRAARTEEAAASLREPAVTPVIMGKDGLDGSAAT